MQNDMTRRSFVSGTLAMGAVAGGAGLIGAAAPALADEAAPGAFDLDAFNAWLKDHHNFGAARGSAFLPGEENAPTDEELVEILEIANSYQWCHMLTAPHFIVIRDPEEQAAITPLMGTTPENATGTVTILVLADGCKDQEYHKDQYTSRHADTHYWQMYYALVEAGEAQAYLNLAAVSKGYRVRNYGAVSIPSISYAEGMGDQEAIPEWACGGDWDMVRADNWDISKYCQPKDGGEPFTHHVMAGDMNVDVDGNLTLLFAMKIGTVDEDAIETTVSSFGPTYTYTDYPQDATQQLYNFSFWDSGARGMDFYEPDPRWEEENASYEAEKAAEDDKAAEK